MIEINGSPLWGKDSSPSVFSAFVSIVGTFIFLIIFIFCLILVKAPPKKEKYKEVQINLSSYPIEEVVKEEPKKVVEEKNEEKIAEVKEEVEEKIEKPIEKKEVVSPKKEVEKPSKKSEEVKKEVASKDDTPKEVKQKKEYKKVPQEYVIGPSNEELMNEQFNRKPKEHLDDFDFDSMFTDDVSTNTSTSESGKVTTKSSVEGSAGSVSDKENERTTSTIKENKNYDESISSSTSSMLERIKNNNYKSVSSTSGTTSEAKIESVQETDGVYIKMDEGRPRRLLNPSNPEITLSEEAISKIDGSKKVNITITVMSAGFVSNVKFTPEAALPPFVKDEITNQIKKWTFDIAEYDAKANFEYNIIKK